MQHLPIKSVPPPGLTGNTFLPRLRSGSGATCSQRRKQRSRCTQLKVTQLNWKTCTVAGGDSTCQRLRPIMSPSLHFTSCSLSGDLRRFKSLLVDSFIRTDQACKLMHRLERVDRRKSFALEHSTSSWGHPLRSTQGQAEQTR